MTKIISVQYPRYCPYHKGKKCLMMICESKCPDEYQFPDKCPYPDGNEYGCDKE